MSDQDTVKPLSETLLSNNWGRLTKHEFELRRRDGTWQHQVREIYDRGNGAACLLHNPATDTVLLTRQFRLPAHINGGFSMLIELPAGLLEGEEPAARMRAELVEETGYEISELNLVYDLFMSPGSVSERLMYFEGTYSDSQKIGDGGGEYHEGEDIEVMHVLFRDAVRMIEIGEIRDAKTVLMLQHLAIKKLMAAGQD